MSSYDQDPVIVRCHACRPARAPIRIDNPPGLAELPWRVGTFASFRATLLQNLTVALDDHDPTLRRLATRAPDDFTVTLIELWSVLADTLTFYHERHANELFLRTARFRDSLVRLARLLDYTPRAATAAVTRLAFTLDREARTRVPAATRVRSVPGEGEQAQVFETLEPFDADARWNRLAVQGVPAAPSTAQELRGCWVVPGEASARAAAFFRVGDRAVVVSPGQEEQPICDAVPIEIAGVTLVGERAFVVFDRPITLPAAGALLYRVAEDLRLFGHDAPAGYVKAEKGDKEQPIQVSYKTTVFQKFTYTSEYALERRTERVKPGDRVVIVRTREEGDALAIREVSQVRDDMVAVGPLEGLTTRITTKKWIPFGVDIRSARILVLDGEPAPTWPFVEPARIDAPQLAILGRRVGIDEIEIGRTCERGEVRHGTRVRLDELPLGRPVFLTDAARTIPATLVRAELLGSSIAVEPTGATMATRMALGLVTGSMQAVGGWISREVVGLDHALSTTSPRRLAVARPGEPTVTVTLPVDAPAVALQGALQTVPGLEHAVVLRRGQRLYLFLARSVAARLLAAEDDPDTVHALGLGPGAATPMDAVWARRPGGNAAFPGGGHLDVRLGLKSGQALTITGSWAQPSVSGGPVGLVVQGREVLLFPLDPIAGQGDWLVLTVSVAEGLGLSPASAALLGNVVPASHGETVREEILGDGDPRVPWQRFSLQKHPLTRIPGTRGAESSLRVFVRGVEWAAAASFIGRRPGEEVFVPRTGPDGKLVVGFGDTTARPAAGPGTVTARYRVGAGSAGAVGAGTLTNLVDRPAGARSVINPLAAEGGADEEAPDVLRRAAPASVRSFDRVVSLRDYEDMALASGEIAKASARPTWFGSAAGVHLTVAAAGGRLLSDEALTRVHTWLDTRRDPRRPLRIDNFVPVPVVLRGSVRVADNHAQAAVAAAVRDAVRGHFAFASRGLGETVRLDRLVAAMQRVAGVAAIDVDEFGFLTTDPTFLQSRGVDATAVAEALRILPARPAGQSGVLPAELAVIEREDSDITLAFTGGRGG